MEVYENPRKRRARGKRRSKRRSSWFAKLLGGGKRKTTKRRGRRKNPFSLRKRAGGGGGGGRGFGGALRAALPAAGGFWAADFFSKLVSDRVSFVSGQKFGRQLFAGVTAAALLMFGRRIPMSRPLAVGMLGWSVWSGLARAGFSGYETASRMRPAGLAGNDDLDGLGYVGQPSYLGDGLGPQNLLGLGDPQAMLFGLGAIDDTYGGRA